MIHVRKLGKHGVPGTGKEREREREIQKRNGVFVCVIHFIQIYIHT